MDNNKKPRSRYAPSPTGYMHLGNLRTALYEYLLMKKYNGTFILRIEDTDQARFVEGATDVIYNTLKKCGLNWDEGPDIGGACAPYVQSERFKTGIYLKYAKQLVDEDKAYYCFCDKERMEKLHKEQTDKGETPHYDRNCRNIKKEKVEELLKSGKDYVIRQKTPETGTTTFHDEIYGDITVENSELDDQILIKSDGMPTYNFANVIDDHEMQITHIVRGNEYLSSTPKYNLLYEAFGWEIPKYIHVTQIMRDPTHKLSKRDGDAYFSDFTEKGFLVPAIINYIALLGWAPKGENEIFDLDGLIEEFDLAGLSKSPALFDPVKMKAINGMHIRLLTLEAFRDMALPYIRKTCKREDIDIDLLCKTLQPRAELLTDIPEQVDFIDKLPEYDTDLYINKKMKTTLESSKLALIEILAALEKLDDFSHNSIHEALVELIEKMNVKNGYVLFPLRVAVSGKHQTPGGGTELCVILGKEESLARIKTGIEKLS